MENSTEVIQQQMTETRAALSEKLEALEEQVLSTVQDTTQNVAETVESTVEDVKEAVEATVSTVTETVQETVQETVSTVRHFFDIQHHVENYPWAAFAGAVVVGYLGSQLLFPERPAAPAAPSPAGPSMGAPSAGAPMPTGEPIATGAPQPPTEQGSTFASTTGGLANLVSSLAPALGKLKELAIGTTAGMLGDMLLAATPETLRESLTEVIDQITTSLGGKPIHGLMKQEDQPSNGKEEEKESKEKGRGQHHSEAQQLRR